MRNATGISLATILLGLMGPVAAAQEVLEFRTIASERGYSLANMEGQPRFVGTPSAITNWTLAETDKGWTIQSRKKDGALYLSVTDEGTVCLTDKLIAGSYWDFTKAKGKKTDYHGTLQTKVDMFSGWYLEFADTGERRERGKFKYMAYHPILQKKPGKRSELQIYLDGL